MIELTWSIIRNYIPNLSLTMGGLVISDMDILDADKWHRRDTIFGDEYLGYSEHDQIRTCIESELDVVMTDLGIDLTPIQETACVDKIVSHINDKIKEKED
mgnify:CR=1 FL=1